MTIFTFLFTDIQDSTKLWEKHPDAMQGALATHDAILRQTIENHDGHVFKTVGDHENRENLISGNTARPR